MPITIPIEIGDVIRTGKFKNKRVTVKEIGVDEYGLPTCNGKGIMKIRIEKLMPPKEPKTETNMNKPNKAKLDKMIREALHSNDAQVKIKQKDKLWWICQEETDECLNAVGFETKEQAEHSALTKGYSFSGQEEMNEMEPEVLTTKKEKVKGVDKVEDMKLDKEKEIKLEILRIAKRVIKEELKKKIGLNELEVNDPDLVKKIEEMARLSDEMDRMANEMKKLKEQFEPLDEEITKLMEETAKTGDRAIETKNVLITIKKEGYEAKSPKYKESFEKLYAKVNATMKKQADEILAANTSIKKYSTTLAVQYKKTENKINEGMFSDLLNKVKSYFSGLYSKIVNLGKQADVEINNLKRLSSL